jgi:hypothetical protein
MASPPRQSPRSCHACTQHTAPEACSAPWPVPPPGPRQKLPAARPPAAGPPDAPAAVAGAALHAAPCAAQHLAPSGNELAASGRCSAAPLHFTLAVQSSQPQPYGLGQLTPLPSACAAPPQCSVAALASVAHGCVACQEDEAVWREMHCQDGPSFRFVDDLGGLDLFLRHA